MAASTTEVLDLIFNLQNLDEIEKLEAQINLLKQKFRELGKSYVGQPGYQADVDNLTSLIGKLDALKGASRATADAQKQASKDAADAAKQAARDVSEAQKQAARDARDAARQAKEAAVQAARDQADAARKAARDAADAAREAARAQADASRQAARRAQRDSDEYVARERRKARQILEISRAVEDAQYGVAGAVNNIPSILNAFNVSDKLIGPISLAVIAATQLYKNWDSLMGLFGQGKIQSESAAMEELAKKTEKTADEAERLARYQQVNKKAEEIREAPTKEQRKTEQGVTEALVEAGQKDIVAGMLKENKAQFDAALPGLQDKDGKLLTDDKGNVRTALSEYEYFKNRRAELDQRRANGGFIAPGHDLVVDRRLAEAEEALRKARENAGLRQLATNALPQFFPNNLNETIKKLQDDPKYLSNLAPEKRQQLLTDLQAATPEGRKKQDQIDLDEERSWDDLQESIKNVKEWSADFKKKVKEATKTKSFLGKDDADLTGAEAEAKKLHDKFEEGVVESLRSLSFMDGNLNIKENENLTPEQQEAARRYQKQVQAREEGERDADRASNEAKSRIQDKIQDNPDADAQLEMEFVKRIGSGYNASQVRAQLKATLKQRYMDADGDLSEGDAEKLATDRVQQAQKGVFEGVTGDARQSHVEMHQGAEAFLQAIQGSFSKDNNANKGVEDRLEKIYDAIVQDQGIQQAVIGQFA